MKIIEFDGRRAEGIIELILTIQNQEAGIGLSLGEQPDLTDIEKSYQENGGNFWIALDDQGKVIGTIGLMKLNDRWAILKKFFVAAAYRFQRIGLKLYETLLDYAKQHGYRHIILDTPSVATKSHAFYRRAGFRQISASDLPVPYNYPDRDSLLFQLDL